MAYLVLTDTKRNPLQTTRVKSMGLGTGHKSTYLQEETHLFAMVIPKGAILSDVKEKMQDLGAKLFVLYEGEARYIEALIIDLDEPA